MTSGSPRKWPIGAELAGGGAHFRVWAPAHQQVTLVLEAPSRRELAMRPQADGYHDMFVDGLAAGARYRFRLGNDPTLHADPASRYQPEGPFGPSEIVDPRGAWTDHEWRGVTQPQKQVLYEMHVGTFTPEGTWRAAASALPFLREIGITTIEMMPVNGFAGNHGWGYDGVNLFAPHHRYGTPADLRAFVDRAHALGLAVILDVVYNHFGPRGNSYYAFAPQFRSERATEWGDAIDFSFPGVRELFTTNAAYWIDEFHFDGFRIDATQAITDRDDHHILSDLVRAARAAAPARTLFIIGENEPQDAHLLDTFGFDALWNDDFHHTARVALTGCTDGYFHDYGGTPQELVSALERGFLYQGQLYAWQRNTRGTPTRTAARSLGRARFVHFLENHDQVANMGFGDRLPALTDPASLRAMTAVLLLGPELPMLFQGQETGSTRPFRFFCDHDGELGRLVEKGRRESLAQFARLATPEMQAVLPDPTVPATFEACVLDPRERTLDNRTVRLVRDLLALRGTIACFTDPSEGAMRGAVLGDRTFCVRWWSEAGDRLLLVNLGATFRASVLPEPLLAPPLRSGWAIEWSSEHPSYGGLGTPEPFTLRHLAIPARSAVLCAPDPTHHLRAKTPPREKGPDEP